MRIRTQFILTLSLFAVIVVAIAMSLVITNREVDSLLQQQQIAQNIERQARELAYLSDDFLLYRESQQRTRWESKFASFSEDVSRLDPKTPEQQILVDNIRANHERLKAVFADVVSTLEDATSTPDAAAEIAFIQVSWSRMEVQNQGMVFDALLLSQKLRDQANRLTQTTEILMFVLFGLFGAYFTVNYFLVYRHTLRSISDLQAGTNIIGSGNLEFAIPDKAADEIGDLARAFNRMTANLKQVTASKADLEREVTERQVAEERVQRLNRDLEHRAVELEIANKELESFSYSVSHDLRAPLSAINGFASILLRDFGQQLPPEAQSYLELVGKNSIEMNQLVESLLRFSRLIRQPLRKQPVDMQALVRQTLADLSPQQQERQVEIVIGDLPPCQADPLLLKQVLVNLLSNALKFTRSREVACIQIGSWELEKKSWRLDKGQALASLDSLGRREEFQPPISNLQPPVYFVRDNGVGFDSAQAEKLFGVFQRLHSEEEYEGTGVGLAIVDRIIRRHGGSVCVEAEVNKGATFYFTLGE